MNLEELRLNKGLLKEISKKKKLGANYDQISTNQQAGNYNENEQTNNGQILSI